MKILIVANAFPPLNSIGSLRPYSWAKYWSLVGHEICVLTSEKNAASGWLDLAIEPEVEKRIRIVAIPFLVFRRKSKPAGASAGNTMTGNGLKAARLLVRFLRKNIFGSFLDSRYFWISPSIKAGEKIYREWKFDLIVSTYDPPAAHIIASHLNKQLGVPWAADYRDLWAGSHIEKPIFPLDSLERWLENRTIKDAMLLSTVSDQLRNQLAERFPQPVVAVENGFDEDDFKTDVKSYEFPPDGCKRILYTGKINRGRQFPEPLFEALAILRRQEKIKKGEIEVLFCGQWLEHLPDLIRRYELEDFVSVLGFLDHRTIISMQRAADLLLFLDFNAQGLDGILTGKLFEYMAAGRPVLGIGMDETKAPARLIHEAGIGISFGFDAIPIAEFLDKYIKGSAVPFHPDQEVINRYSRRKMAEKLLQNITSRLEEQAQRIEAG